MKDNHNFFFAVVHHDEGSAYGVSFPDVPDCFAAADDQKDVMRHAICALEDYFADGHEVPTPRGVEDIKQELKEDLAEGAFLISVPLIPRPVKSTRVNISLDQGLLAVIDEAAERLELNRSAFLALAAANEIKHQHDAC